MGSSLFKNFLAASWGKELIDGIKPVLVYIFAVAGVASTGYIVFLCFRLAQAPDSGKRKKAKDQIFKVISGLFIILILTVVLFEPTFYNAIFGGTKDMTGYRFENKVCLSRCGDYNIWYFEKTPLHVIANGDTTKYYNISNISIESTSGDITSSNIELKKVSDTEWTIAAKAAKAGYATLSAKGKGFDSTDEEITYFTNEVIEFKVINNSTGGTSSGGTSTGGSGGSESSSATGLYNEFTMPVKNASMNYGFGPRNLLGGSSNHKGVDISASDSSSTSAKAIYPSAKGTVVATVNTSYEHYTYNQTGEVTIIPGAVTTANGSYIVIQHVINLNAVAKGESPKYLYTWYKHLEYNSIKVKKGDVVYPTDIIATMGRTGQISKSVPYVAGGTAGIHLHFEITSTQSGGIYYDPYHPTYCYTGSGFGNCTALFEVIKG